MTRAFSTSRRNIVALSLASALLAACSSTTEATGPAAAKSYTVDAASSSVTFVSTKAGAAGVGGVTETSRFTRYTGGLDAQGRINLAIDLTSVESGIEIRDQRLQTMLWNVKANPTAVFKAQLPAASMTLVGRSGQAIDVDGELTLAGQSKPISAKLHVTSLPDGALLVSTQAPIVVNANDFGLKAGVEALREVVGLNFLSSSAPVSLSLKLKSI
jgi:polyisoprenoid-binding protein YceI